MKEKILEAFKALGFEMEELEGMGYRKGLQDRICLYCRDTDTGSLKANVSLMRKGSTFVPYEDNLYRGTEQYAL